MDVSQLVLETRCFLPANNDQKTRSHQISPTVRTDARRPSRPREHDGLIQHIGAARNNTRHNHATVQDTRRSDWNISPQRDRILIASRLLGEGLCDGGHEGVLSVVLGDISRADAVRQG